MSKDSANSKVKHGIHIILVSSFAGANLATIVLMLGCCLSTYLSPELHPRLSQAGLLFPVFLAIDLMFVIVWLLTSWKWILLPILGVCCCWGFVWDYFPMNIRQLTHAQVDSMVSYEGIHLLSYNVAGFANDSANGMNGSKTAEYIYHSNAAIICLQECPQSGTVYKTLSAQLDSMGYETRAHKGLNVFSKYPFIGDAVYKSPASCSNGSMAWLINIKGDTVLVINNHLQSNCISSEEKMIYGKAIDEYNEEQIKASGKILLHRLTQAASGRAAQTDSLCNLIRSNLTKYSIISAGDMNDTPISYTYQRVSKLLKCAYAESGIGLGISFNRKGFPIRIDHVFVSNDLKTGSTYIDSNIHSSDHRPLQTHIFKSAK